MAYPQTYIKQQVQKPMDKELIRLKEVTNHENHITNASTSFFTTATKL